MDCDENDGRCLIDHEAFMMSIDCMIEMFGPDYGIGSRSGLAKAAGLCATSLNPGKMQQNETWLTVSSLLKLCEALGVSIVDWALIYQDIASRRAPKVTGFRVEGVRNFNFPGVTAYG